MKLEENVPALNTGAEHESISNTHEDLVAPNSEIANIMPSQPNQSGFTGTGLAQATPAATNLTELLQNGSYGRLRWDRFSRRILITRHGLDEILTNPHVVDIQNQLATQLQLKPRKRDLEDAIELAAYSNQFDSAQDWLAALPSWDGVPRIDQFLPTYLKTKSGQYETSVSRYWWTAMVSRILDPGCKADMVPVLVGPQGTFKTTALNLIAPLPGFCIDVNLTENGMRLGVKLVGKSLVIWEELRGIRGRVDADEVKTFITQRYFEIFHVTCSPFLLHS